MEYFAGKRAVITGGASGIGWATAQQLARCGAQVVLWDRNVLALERAALALRPVSSVCSDVTDVAAVQAGMEMAADALGGIDLVIHCAGILRTGMFETMPSDMQLRLITVNLGGTAVVAGAAIPYLRQTRGGLVLMGSASGIHGTPEYAMYGATKAAVINLAQALRLELQGAGIYVGVANPASVITPMLDEHNRGSWVFRSRSPLLTELTPEQVAAWLLRGVVRRDFDIWMGWRARLSYWCSRYGAAFAHRVMRAEWQRARGG